MRSQGQAPWSPARPGRERRRSGDVHLGPFPARKTTRGEGKGRGRTPTPGSNCFAGGAGITQVSAELQRIQLLSVPAAPGKPGRAAPARRSLEPPFPGALAPQPVRPALRAGFLRARPCRAPRSPGPRAVPVLRPQAPGSCRCRPARGGERRSALSPSPVTG